MQKIGMITIGQTPRDDIISGMRRYLTHKVEILQRGALDDVDQFTVAQLRPEVDQPTLVTTMRDGSKVTVTHEKILPMLQNSVNDLVQAGVEFIVLLCTGELLELQAEPLILYPDRLLRGVVTALANGTRLGVVLPSADQIPQAEERKVETWGGLDVVFTAASPYAESETKAHEWRQVSQELKRSGVNLVFLDCMGMDEEMKRTVQSVTQKPVLLARSIVARMVDELLGYTTRR
jgi:protein AroM